MESLPENKILKFRPDTLEAVRKHTNLDKNTIDQSIDLLQNWLQKQEHFTKKDFSREYLERKLVTCKGSVERTKQRLDKLCTFKTLMPEYFNITDVKKELAVVKEYVDFALLPKITHEHYRIVLTKSKNDTFSSEQLLLFYKYLIMNGEYIFRCDYNSGIRVILDYRDVNPFIIAAKSGPVEFRNMLTLLIESFGMRVKSIHILSNSKLVDALVTLFKQVFSEKISRRITVHTTLESLYEYVNKEVLPVEFGGEEKSMKELSDELFDELASDDFMEYYADMRKASSIESRRPGNQFNEHYAGMPGSFRVLSVD